MARKKVRPFEFVSCMELREMLGRRARDEQELVEALEDVPQESIYYHTHSFFLRHKYMAGVFPNDFATWVAIQVRDKALGEQLSIIDPFDYKDMEVLREELITIIDRHLSRIPITPKVVYGEAFYFARSTIIEVLTGIISRNLTEFYNALSNVDASAIYFHFFEARRRNKERKNDFTLWMKEQLGMQNLAEKMDFIPYMRSLEVVREKLLGLCKEETSN